MIVISHWTQAAGAADLLWRHGVGFGSGRGPSWRQNLQAALDALGPNPSPDAVKALWPSAIGLTCHECERDVEEVVEVGEEPDYESHTARLCGQCLLKTLTLLER